MPVSVLAESELGSEAQRERRKRILDATYELAREGGFDAVQMRAVADKAEVALGTLYRYFPSKIHLLVTALAREFERADTAMSSNPVPGDTRADRVIHLLRSLTRGLQDDQHLTEALTRALMFADPSARPGIKGVGRRLVRVQPRAVEPEAVDPGSGGAGPTEEDAAIARVIADVWLAALMAWVTGRSSAEETSAHMERAVRLILR